MVSQSKYLKKRLKKPKESLFSLILPNVAADGEIKMITIQTIKDIGVSLDRAWICRNCIPEKQRLAHGSLENIYTIDHIVSVIQKKIKETEANYNLATSQRTRALKNLADAEKKILRFQMKSKNNENIRKMSA